MEADEVAGVVGKGLHATQGAEQSLTVDGELVGIVLGNHGVVVGIASLDKAALDGAIAEVHLGIALVEADDDVATVLTQQVLQQRGGLLGQDEGGGLLALHREHLVAYQLVTIACHNGQPIGGQVEVDAVHHGAQLVLCRCEERAVDVVAQHLVGDDDGGGLVAHLLCHGELVGILHGQ